MAVAERLALYDLTGVSFEEALRQESRTWRLIGILKDCSDYSEEQVVYLNAELFRRFDNKARESGLSEREKLILTLFACSADEKQYSFGMEALIEFVSKGELEQYWTAIYHFARTPEGCEKSIPRMKAGTHIMRDRPGEELVDVMYELAVVHTVFMDQVSFYYSDEN